MDKTKTNNNIEIVNWLIKNLVQVEYERFLIIYSLILFKLF
jgi:hypothetical protein